MDLSKLKEPFPADQIEWRLAQCGKGPKGIWGFCLAYVQARAVMDRLDEVCGPFNWKAEYNFIGTTGVVCRLSLGSKDTGWLTKEDGAEMTEIESFKGGISDAFKRAAVTWGISRYLYDLDPNMFIRVVDKDHLGARYGKTKEGEVFYWLPPTLPDWALPKKETKIATGHSPHPQPVAVTRAPLVPPSSSVPSSQDPKEYVAPIGRPDVKGKKLKDLRQDQLEGAYAYWKTSGRRDPVTLEYLMKLEAMLPPAPMIKPATEAVAPSTLFENPPAWVTEDVPVSQQPIWNPDELKE